MKSFLNESSGYITYDEPPSNNAAGFYKDVKRFEAKL